MVKINDPSANPDTFKYGPPKIVTINWTGRIKQGDNKVDIYFSIEDNENCPVYFVDESGNFKKKVFIDTYDFKVVDETYYGAAYLVVTEPRPVETPAIITVTAIDKNGNGQTDSDVCTIMYK